MNNVYKLEKRRRQASPWSAGPQPRRPLKRTRSVLTTYSGFLALAFIVGIAVSHSPPFSPEGAAPSLNEEQRVGSSFSICAFGPRINCIVDGDTFYVGGEKIRIADINTPELSEPQCEREAALARKARQRLQKLLNAGPIELRQTTTRNRDAYGRKLRSVYRNDHSLGDTLVAEGLAHPWRGYKESWCG